MTTPALYQPAIPASIRTAVYVLGLVVGFLSILAIGLVAIFWPDVATQATAAAGVVGTAVGFLASALGVVYRPTAGRDGITVDLAAGGFAAIGAALRGLGVTFVDSTEAEADEQAAGNDRSAFPYTDGDDAA